MYLVEQGA